MPPPSRGPRTSITLGVRFKGCDYFDAWVTGQVSGIVHVYSLLHRDQASEIEVRERLGNSGPWV